MIDALNFILLDVSDIKEARAFYTDKLGFEIEDESPAFIQFKQAPGGAIFALQEVAGATAHQGVNLWWTVADADGVYAQLLEKGVTIASPPKDEPFGRTLSIKDPANNALNLFQLPTGK